MNAALAVSDGIVFGIGAVVFIAAATAAFGLGMLRFAELGEQEERGDDPR